MNQTPDQFIVGGGVKKILYTLNTARKMGLNKSAKALTSANACKACGLGMGGQRGGMVNELGEFPAVCNKSVQAQSSDTQAAIPEEVFQHSISDFKQLSGYQMEKLGRLNTPLIKQEGSDHFEPTDWHTALDFAAQHFAGALPERSFFYSSGRSSNEAGFVLQLLARMYGTNNVSNCSYYCHQATGVGLASTIGTGTSTIELDDLVGCDLIFVIGANPSSNHPRFLHKLAACRQRGGQVIIINPAKEPGLVRFALPKSPKSLLKGGDDIASEYLQPKIGSDICLLNGIAKAVVELNAQDTDFIKAFTQNYDAYLDLLNQLSWAQIVEETGIEKENIQKIARLYSQSEHAVFAWGMGITHHLHGAENVESIANLAILRGMVGKQQAGLLPLRGHSNVQGIGSIGVKPVLAEEVLAKIENHFNVKLPEKKGMDTLASIEAADRGEIDNALIMGGNLLEATPDNDWAVQAMDKIGFKLFLTTTLNRGHVHGIDTKPVVILPVAARDEEPQTTTQESMFNYVRLSEGGIDRLQNTHSEVEILCDLAQRLLPDSPIDFAKFYSHQSIREAIAHTVPGFEELADIEVSKHEFHVRNRLKHQPEFNTPNGKARFIPRHSQRPVSDSQRYPYTLMSIRSEGQFNSIIYEEKDSYRNTSSRWTLLMSKVDMIELDIEDGNLVNLRSAHGEMLGVKVQPYNLPKGNMMAYYPEANVLVGREVDPRTKTPSFKAVAVAIERVQ